MKLDKKKILKFQKNKPPYLFLDYITKLIPGKIANGYKILRSNEWFFKVHWQGDPNMPGMLQIEALVQLAALTILGKKKNRGKIVYLVSVEKAEFKRKILPGDKLTMTSKLIKYNRGIGLCEAEGKVAKKIACRAKFKIAFPQDMVKI